MCCMYVLTGLCIYLNIFIIHILCAYTPITCKERPWCHKVDGPNSTSPLRFGVSWHREVWRGGLVCLPHKSYHQFKILQGLISLRQWYSVRGYPAQPPWFRYLQFFSELGDLHRSSVLRGPWQTQHASECSNWACFSTNLSLRGSFAGKPWRLQHVYFIT